MSSALTKKQQKAQAFRAKQKIKKRGGDAPEDIPEHDLEEDEPVIDPSGSASASGPAGQKRKRGTADARELQAVQLDGKERKAIGKGKSKSDWDDGEGEEGIAKKRSKKEVKQRFILFVGNMSYKTTQSEIHRHFKDALEYTPSVRLLTTKPTPTAPSKSRGIAFLEVNSSADIQSCLKLHHSTLAGRRINVELTAGGGGKTTARKEKIASRNERVGGQRERRAEKEKAEAGIVAEGEVPQEGEPKGGEGDVVTDGANDKVRIRGGRRVKVKSQVSYAPPLAGQTKRQNEKTPQAANSALPGWQKRHATSAPKARPNGRRKFEPTGANAVSVG